jgi:succinate dehydrogenase/fumarate reductase flavoprotein subunit
MLTWDERTDVTVVGSGLAGLAAAIEAAKAGAAVSTAPAAWAAAP